MREITSTMLKINICVKKLRNLDNDMLKKITCQWNYKDNDIVKIEIIKIEIVLGYSIYFEKDDKIFKLIVVQWKKEKIA